MTPASLLLDSALISRTNLNFYGEKICKETEKKLFSLILNFEFKKESVTAKNINWNLRNYVLGLHGILLILYNILNTGSYEKE